jgi:hypothetical protein
MKSACSPIDTCGNSYDFNSNRPFLAAARAIQGQRVLQAGTGADGDAAGSGREFATGMLIKNCPFELVFGAVCGEVGNLRLEPGNRSWIALSPKAVCANEAAKVSIRGV